MLAFEATQALGNFKLQILSKELTGEIQISQPQTFINHMVNELN